MSWKYDKGKIGKIRTQNSPKATQSDFYRDFLRYPRLYILARWGWNSKVWMWSLIFPGDYWRYLKIQLLIFWSIQVYSPCTCFLLCGSDRWEGLLHLFLIYSNDMVLPDYSDMEIEANAHTPIASNHHLHIPRGYDSRKLLDRIHSEALEQIEPGQNLGVYPFGSPVNTFK